MSDIQHSYSADYRGIDYRITRKNDGNVEYRVFFPDGEESGEYSPKPNRADNWAEGMAIIAAENLIDNNAGDNNWRIAEHNQEWL